MAGKVSCPSRQAIVARTIAVMQARSRSCRKFLPAPPTVDAVAGSTLRDEANRRNPYFSGLKCPFEWRPQRQKPIACGQESAGNQSNPLQRRVRKIVRQHGSANVDGKRRRETEAHFWRGETRDAAAAGDRGSRGTVTQSPDFGCERSPERLIGSPRVTKWPSNSAALNLPLAARPRVGHIGLTGDVAEWLKAAVC